MITIWGLARFLQTNLRSSWMSIASRFLRPPTDSSKLSSSLARRWRIRWSQAIGDAKKIAKDGDAVKRLQAILDPMCVAEVNINAESRVKVKEGEGPKRN